jgi:hypothetical protein
MYVPGKGPGLHPSGVHGPRLKSLDLPKWLYIHTYVHTYLHPYMYIAARNLPGLCSALLCSVLSCPVLFYASRLFRRQYHQYALPCPALQRTTLHCTILHCAVPWAACIRRVCCRVPSHYHRPGLSFSVANTPTARKRYRVHRARPCPLSRISDHLPTTNPQAGDVRASNPYLLVRDMNEDRPHTGR